MICNRDNGDGADGWGNLSRGTMETQPWVWVWVCRIARGWVFLVWVLWLNPKLAQSYLGFEWLERQKRRKIRKIFRRAMILSVYGCLGVWRGEQWWRKGRKAHFNMSKGIPSCLIMLWLRICLISYCFLKFYFHFFLNFLYFHIKHEFQVIFLSLTWNLMWQICLKSTWFNGFCAFCKKMVVQWVDVKKSSSVIKM